VSRLPLACKKMKYWEMIERDLLSAGCSVERIQIGDRWRVEVRRDNRVWIAEAEEVLAAFLEVEAGVRSSGQ